MIQQSWSCLILLTHEIVRAFCLALVSAGKSKAARMAMMAMTTSNSMSVKDRTERAWRGRSAARDRCLRALEESGTRDLIGLWTFCETRLGPWSVEDKRIRRVSGVECRVGKCRGRKPNAK